MVVQFSIVKEYKINECVNVILLMPNSCVYPPCEGAHYVYHTSANGTVTLIEVGSSAPEGAQYVVETSANGTTTLVQVGSGTAGT